MEYSWILGLAATVGIAAAAQPLKVGSKAPDFVLPDQTGQLQRLAAMRGKKAVILAFYVVDATAG